VWLFGAIGRTSANAHRNFRPVSPPPTCRQNPFCSCPSAKVIAQFRVSASIDQFGGADEASSSPSYREPPSSSRFCPTPLTSNHLKLVALRKSPAQTTCNSTFPVKSCSSFLQPDERSLTITIDRGHATKINVQRTWGAYRNSQVLCRRALE